MVPAAFVRLDALPTNANDKLDRAALPAPDAANTLPEGSADGASGGEGGEAANAPIGPTEQRLAAILAGLLRVKRVSRDDNFFLLGGHSLLGTQAISRIAQAFGVELTLAAIFEAPTVRALAAVVETRLVETIAALSDAEARALLG